MNKKIRIGITTGSFFIYVLMFFSAASPVSALSLNLSLPIGEALQPVTNLLNPITQSLPVAPITVNPTNGPIGVNLALPTATPSTPPPSTSPTTPSTTTPSLSTPTTTNIPTKSPVTSKPTRKQDSPSSPIDAVASFFTSTLPGAVNAVATFIAGKRVDPVPIIISTVIFAVTLVIIGMIVYSSTHSGTLRIGRFNLARLAQAHDLTQMVTLIIVTLCFGFVAIYLSLTVL